MDLSYNIITFMNIITLFNKNSNINIILSNLPGLHFAIHKCITFDQGGLDLLTLNGEGQQLFECNEY